MVSTRFGVGPRVLSRGLACACLLIVTGMAGRAYAVGDGVDSDRANSLFKKGKVAFNAGKYNDALRIYSEAWSLKQSPDIAANLAQTESELGRHRDAAEHFSFALAHLLPSSTDEQKQALAEGLAQEKKEIGSLHVTLEPGDSVLTIDDAAVTVPANGRDLPRARRARRVSHPNRLRAESTDGSLVQRRIPSPLDQADANRRAPRGAHRSGAWLEHPNGYHPGCT